MEKNGKVKGSEMKRTALVVGSLCIACCAAPLLGLFAGSTAVVFLANYSETLAITAIVIGFGIVIFKHIRRKSGDAYRLDKGCGPRRNVGEE